MEEIELLKKKLKREKARNEQLEQILENRTRELYTANEKYHKERNLFKEYLDLTGVMIIVIDPDGNVELVNREGCEILEYKENEISGKNWFDIFIPERNRKKEKDVFRKLCSGEIEPIRHYENPVLTKSGKEKIVTWNISVIKDKNGKVTAGIGSGEDITARNRVERALKESEEKFRNIFNAASDGIVYATKTGVILDVNPALLKISGIPKEEMVGKSVFKIIKNIMKPSNIPGFVKVIKSVLSGKFDGYYEMDINERLVQIKSSFIGKESSDVISILRDVTAEKQTENALKYEKAYFEQLFENSPEAVVLTDNEGGVLRVNSEFKRMFGYSTMEALGHSIDELITGELKEEGKSFTAKLAKGKRIAAETIRRHKNGKEIHVSILGTPVNIDGGQEAVYSIYRNISERKKIENELEKERHLFKTLLDNIPDLIYFKDTKARFLRISKSLADYYDDTVENVIGKSDYDYYLKELADMKYKDDITVIETEKPIINFEEYGETFKGKSTWYSSTKLPLYDHDGRLMGMFGISRDITDRKKAEKLTQVLYDISQSVHTAADLNELFQKIYFSLGKIIDTRNFYIALYDSHSDTLSFPYFHDNMDKPYKPLKISGNKSSCAYVIRNKKTLFRTEKIYKKLIENEEIVQSGSKAKIWLGVPLLIGDEVIGVIVVQSYVNPDAYNEKDVMLLESVSNQIAVVIDVKRKEEEIKKLFHAVEQSPSIVVITDKNGNIDYVNPKFTEITGYSFEDVQGQNPRILKSGVHSDDFYRNLWETITSGYEWRGEFHNKKKNGDFYWESVSISPILNENEEITHFIAVKEDITERKKIQEEVLKQKQFLISVLEAINTPFYVIDVNNYKIIHANSAAVNEKFTENVTCHLLTHNSNSPCKAPDHECPIEIVKKTKSSVTVEHLHYDKDGNPRNVEVHGYPIFDNNGDVVQVIEYSIDITDRKESEEALRESEERFRLLFENASDGITIVDLETQKFTSVNKKMSEISGYSLEEFKNMSIEDLHPKDDLDHIIEAIQKLLKGESLPVRDTPILNKDGTLIYTDIRPTPVTIGEKIYIIGFFRDITERKKSEEALRESEERFRLLFENAGDGILIADTVTRKFLSVNKKILELTGYSMEELLKLRVEDIHPKEDMPWIAEEFKKQAEGKLDILSDAPILKKNGDIFFSDINASPIILNGKKYLVGMFRDVTERKKLEKEKIRTSQLETIQKMIVTLNHEMNQPLSIIISNSEILLSETEKDSQSFEDLKIIKDEAWKLAGLLKKVQEMKKVKITEYVKGTEMIDLNDSSSDEQDKTENGE